LFATLLLAQESPRQPRRWRANAPGAVLTVLGWSAATGLLPVYVAVATHVSPTLGSLGGGLIVLAWLYLMTLSLFLGAELNATRHPRPALSRDSAAPGPDTGGDWLDRPPLHHVRPDPGESSRSRRIRPDSARRRSTRRRLEAPIVSRCHRG